MVRRARYALLAAAVLAGCAELPSPRPGTQGPPPSAPPAVRAVPANPHAATIEAWRQRALQHRASGDLANAAIAWHVLTLLAPDEPAYRKELADARAAMRHEVAAELAAGKAALQGGDTERAIQALLRVLAVDPDHAEAAQALRDIEKHKLARIQEERANRAKVEEAPSRSARSTRSSAPPENGTAYDLEQGIEMFNAGDTAGGLRELRSWVEHNTGDRAGRQRAGAAVFERGKELEAQGEREEALALYDHAVAMRGEPAAGWGARIQSVRRKVAAEYYDRATRSERSDLAAAIKALETSLRYDPSNARASTKLAQLKVAQAKLRALEKAGVR